MAASAVVQIVHYSDLHIVGPDYLSQRRRFDSLLQRLPGVMKQGVAGASLAALKAFEAFLSDIASEPSWRDRPIWLVDTGDGTTFGDDHSLDAWLNDWSPRFQAAAGPNASQVVLYGNHDAWPGTFPLLAPRSMDSHRNSLRATRFRQTWPAQPLRLPLLGGNGGPEVQLFALNSVDHDLLANIKALGKVLPDRFWQSMGGMTGPTASSDLDRLAYASAGGLAHLRILAMHYPVAAEATKGKRLLEILANRDDFARDLRNPRHMSAKEPLVHIHLAGHTHTAYPPLGLLPNGLGSAQHPPLAAATAQLVTPSLSQTPVVAFSGATPDYYPDACAQSFPYQCTLLRILAEQVPGGGVDVTVQRYLVGRPVGGAFGYLPVAEGTSRHHEELRLML
jgi:hypothetical protein